MDVVEFIKRHRRVALAGAGLLALLGADLVLFPPKEALLLGVGFVFLGAGLAILVLVVRPTSPETESTGASIAARLIHRLTLGGRLVPWLPAAGITVVLGDLAYNAYLSATPGLGTEDTFALLLGAALIAYPYVPPSFRRERDFVLVALSFLFVGLVIPLVLARALSRNWEYSVDLYSWAALVHQVAAVLWAIGVPTTVHAIPGSTAPALTVVTKSGAQLTLVITTACSGLYSFGLFTAAFFAYVVTEFRKLTWRVWSFLALGAAASYFANILRMVVIVLAGTSADSAQESVQNLLIAHSNAGWLIFLAWIGLFWLLLVRFLRPDPDGTGGKDAATGEAGPAPKPFRRGVYCDLCDDVLTPARPGYRCECGTFYHAACAASRQECPRCRRPMAPGSPSSATDT